MESTEKKLKLRQRSKQSGSAPTGRRRGFAVCVKGTGFDTMPGKTYRIIEDRVSSRDGWIRVIDESGEDYLYPTSWFVPVRPAKAFERRLASAIRAAVSNPEERGV